MSLRVRGAVLSDDAVVSIVRGAVATVEGARLDRPSRIARVLPGRRGPSSGASTATASASTWTWPSVYGRPLPGTAERRARQRGRRRSAR